MGVINTVMEFLNGKMETPTMYGWFHLMMIGIILAVTITICIVFRNSTEKQNNIIILTMGFICLILEIYKQLNFSYNDGDWTYQWYAFPFQFCSTPMYIAILAGFLKDGKVRDCLYAFIATYGLFAGLAVYVMPNDVFVSTIGINIQSLVHHGLQIVLGIYLIASKRVELKPKTILKASCVFIILVAIAMCMNVATYYLGLKDTFNMFYISPWYGCHLPILSIIFGAVPYPIFLGVYIFGFTISAFVMLMLVKLITMLFRRKTA
jgi:hypothetical protein